jgi:tetratricopeptide (TPR) repeat protein/predicted aspartyl protease
MRGFWAAAVLGALALANAGAALASCALQKKAELPVSMAGPRATVSAKINGVDATLFIDTGAFFSMLNPSDVTRFGLQTRPGFRVRGLTGTAEVRVARVKDLGFLGVQLHGYDFLIGEHDLDQGNGVIGQNLLAFLDTEFDFANGAIRLMSPKDCANQALAYWATGRSDYGAMPIEPTTPPDYRIVGGAMLNGKRIKVEFDTGSPRSMISLSAAKRAGFVATGQGSTPDGMIRSLSRTPVRVWVGNFDSLEIGGESIKNTRLMVGDFDLGDIDMLIGADFFLSHRIYVARGQDRLYFTYNGGPVFNLQGEQAATAAPPPGADIDPKDPAALRRRAEASVSRGAYAAAVADFTSAIALEPSEPRDLVERAEAYWRAGKMDQALTDLTAALALKPGDPKTTLLRGDLELRRGDVAGARRDFEATTKLDPQLRLNVADIYESADRFADAVALLDAWIADDQTSAGLADAYNKRCWSRALWGQDLDKAEADCDTALRLRPRTYAFLDSRGLVRLRRGELDPAIADYSAALKLYPTGAWSLYGRGIAELKLGLKPQGDADIAKAVTGYPQIAAMAKKYGIAPP